MDARSPTSRESSRPHRVPGAPPAHAHTGEILTAITVSVPRESALVPGADAVAQAIAGHAVTDHESVRLVRDGSRGLLWAEPFVEVALAGTRVAYGPVTANDVPGLYRAGFLRGGDHRLRLGPTEDIGYLKNQDRVVLARVGVVDPGALDDHLAHGGYEGLTWALSMAPAEVVGETLASGGSGEDRGWRGALEAWGRSGQVTCEADAGALADRLLIEGDPFALIEGMAVAGLTAGAVTGAIHLRGGSPHVDALLEQVVGAARRRAYLGADLRWSGKAFDLDVHLDAAEVPGAPAVAIDVIDVVSLAALLLAGEDDHTAGPAGTLLFELSGVKRPGLVEKAAGVTLRELVDGFGGGAASGRADESVWLGSRRGGTHVTSAHFDVPLDGRVLSERGVGRSDVVVAVGGVRS